MINYIKGDLISLAKNATFDVVVHGVNCFNSQSAGIAKSFAAEFKTNDSTLYRLESERFKGDINKLGQVEFKHHTLDQKSGKSVIVVNAYTQYRYGTKQINVDYDALRLCMRKLNVRFKGKHIGMPAIGSGLAGGDWSIIERILQKELVDCELTVVLYEKKKEDQTETYQEEKQHENTTNPPQ